jgi:hypothetical protein
MIRTLGITFGDLHFEQFSICRTYALLTIAKRLELLTLGGTSNARIERLPARKQRQQRNHATLMRGKLAGCPLE